MDKATISYDKKSFLDEINIFLYDLKLRFKSSIENLETLHDSFCSLRIKFKSNRHLYNINLAEISDKELKYSDKETRESILRKKFGLKTLKDKIDALMLNFDNFLKKVEQGEKIEIDEYMLIETLLDSIIEEIEYILKILR